MRQPFDASVHMRPRPQADQVSDPSALQQLNAKSEPRALASASAAPVPTLSATADQVSDPSALPASTVLAASHRTPTAFHRIASPAARHRMAPTRGPRANYPTLATSDAHKRRCESNSGSAFRASSRYGLEPKWLRTGVGGSKVCNQCLFRPYCVTLGGRRRCLALCASPVRKPCAPGSSSRISTRDSSTGGRRPGGRRPTVEDGRPDGAPPCRHILEEDPGAQGFRTGLAHRAGAYPEAAILSSGLWQATNQPINRFGGGGAAELMPPYNSEVPVRLFLSVHYFLVFLLFFSTHVQYVVFLGA